MDPALGAAIFQVRNSTIESPGTTWWRVSLGTDSEANPIVGLSNTTGSVSETIPLTGDGYHTYVMEKTSADGSDDTVNLYADGVLIKEDWDSGMVYTSRQQVVWGHNNRSADLSSLAHYNFIRFEGLPAEGCSPGDADNDGDVDDDDLSLLLANWGSETSDCSQGEFSGTPPVNDDDLSLLLANWTGPLSAAMPEPAMMGLLALGALALRRRRR